MIRCPRQRRVDYGVDSESQHRSNGGWPSSPHHSSKPRSEMATIVAPLNLSVYPPSMSGGF